MEDLSGMYLVVFVFLVVLALLWFLLPFAVFGIKDKLGALLAEVKIANKQLGELKSEIVTLKSGDSQ